MGRPRIAGRDPDNQRQEHPLDLVRSDLLPPILIRDMHREARRQALVHLAASRRGRRKPALAARLGAALVLAGCRLQAAGLRLTAFSPLVGPAPCGCGA